MPRGASLTARGSARNARRRHVEHADGLRGCPEARRKRNRRTFRPERDRSRRTSSLAPRPEYGPGMYGQVQRGRSSKRHGEQFDAGDGLVPFLCESQTRGISEVRVERGLVREGQKMDLVRTTVRSIAQSATDDLSPMGGNKGEHPVLRGQKDWPTGLRAPRGDSRARSRCRGPYADPRECLTASADELRLLRRETALTQPRTIRRREQTALLREGPTSTSSPGHGRSRTPRGVCGHEKGARARRDPQDLCVVSSPLDR